jgi:hypothetical protein
MARVNPFSQTESGRTWFHRGFMCFLKQRLRQIRCIYKVNGCNLWIPREFVWQNSSKADCNHYMDLLCRKQIADAKAIEDQGLVKDAIYDPGISEDRPFVNISPMRLLAMMRGEEVLEIPVDARIRFRPNNNHYTVNDIDAAIFSKELTEEYLRSLRRVVGEGRPIIAVNTPEEKALLEKYGMRLVDAKMHSGANLDIAREEYGEPITTQTPGAPAPVTETEVSAKQFDTHTETVSLITGNSQLPYFVKRLLRHQHLLWSGTSYQANGPWTEYTRDISRLTALNLRIP